MKKQEKTEKMYEKKELKNLCHFFQKQKIIIIWSQEQERNKFLLIIFFIKTFWFAEFLKNKIVFEWWEDIKKVTLSRRKKKLKYSGFHYFFFFNFLFFDIKYQKRKMI